MPKVAEPPKVELPPNRVRLAGKQEHFQEAGFALAAAIGFEGEPHLQSEAGIRVEDAQNFLVKTLHEHFQAAGLGHDQPDPVLACEHLGVTDDAECALVKDACDKAFAEGKDATVTEVDKKVVGAAAALVQRKGG